MTAPVVFQDALYSTSNASKLNFPDTPTCAHGTRIRDVPRGNPLEPYFITAKAGKDSP